MHVDAQERTGPQPLAAPPPTMTLLEVAAAFQITPQHMQNKLRGLELQGFPRKLPGTQRWSRQLVLDWINFRDTQTEAAQ